METTCKIIISKLSIRNLRSLSVIIRAVARELIGGGGCIFIYSGSARLVSFEMKLNSKEVSRAEPEYMNIHPPISVLATALVIIMRLIKIHTSLNQAKTPQESCQFYQLVATSIKLQQVC